VKTSQIESIESGWEQPEELEVRVARNAEDWNLAKSALFEEHSLGAGAEAGDRLCQLVYEREKLVAVLVWCAAAFHLKGRDEFIGWDPVTRAQRLKLVVQNRRFLLLEATRRPNLASQSLGAGLRKLVVQWEQEHGYRPLLAETFSDPESHAGTVYKATNWVLAGTTAGFSRDALDFYVPNGRPKKLWLKELAPEARALMCARELPQTCQGALTAGAGARSPLKVPKLNSHSSQGAAAGERAEAGSGGNDLTGKAFHGLNLEFFGTASLGRSTSLSNSGSAAALHAALKAAAA
jgi:hypothetical protein